MTIKPIKNTKDHKAALHRVEQLWEAKPNTPAGDELDVLTTLVDAYENEHYPIMPPDPVEAIKFRMEQMGLRKVDLAAYLGGRNRVSEVLQKKRRLTVRMMVALHQKLHIPAESLLV